MITSFAMIETANDHRSSVSGDGNWDSYGGADDSSWVQFGVAASDYSTFWSVSLNTSTAVVFVVTGTGTSRSLGAYVVDISTGTPVFGSLVGIDSNFLGGNFQFDVNWGAFRIDDNRLLLVYTNGATSKSINTRVLTISGSSISLGTIYQMEVATTTTKYMVSGAYVSAGTFMFNYIIGSTYYNRLAFVASDNTVTYNTAASTASGNTSLYYISDNNVLAAYTSTTKKYQVCSISGSTITYNTAYDTSITGSNAVLVALKDGFVYQNNSTRAFYKLNISGTTITATQLKGILGLDNTDGTTAVVSNYVFKYDNTNSLTTMWYVDFTNNVAYINTRKAYTKINKGSAVNPNRFLCFSYSGSGTKPQCKLISNGY